MLFLVQTDTARQNKCTALHEAARGGYTDIVTLLIDAKANVNAVDKVS